MQLTPIQELKPGDRGKLIEAKVYRAWTARDPPSTTEKGIRAMLLDRQGTPIQANIDADDMYDFKHLLIPGKAYQISGFQCIKTDNWQQTLHNKTSLKFTRLTKMEAIPAEPFPDHYFNFVSYNQLPNKLWDPRDRGKKEYPVLTDYIGCYITSGEPRDVGDPIRNQSRMRKVEIQNLNRNSIEVTLWDDLADDFKKEAIEELERPIIIAVTSCKVSRFQKRELQLSSTPATYYYINPKIPQLEQYKAAYRELHQEKAPLCVTRYRLQDVEQEKNKNRIPLAILLTHNPDAYRGVRFSCQARIMNLNKNRDWYYPSCNACTFKVTETDGNYACDHHGVIPAPNYRYNFRATVTDGTATAQFVFFTPKADEFVGDCATLVKANENRGPRHFPQELEAIVDAMHTFQFHYSPTCKEGYIEFVVNEIFDMKTAAKQIEGQSSGATPLTKHLAAIEYNAPTTKEIQTVEQEAKNKAPAQYPAETTATSVTETPQETQTEEETTTPTPSYTGMQTRSKGDITSDSGHKSVRRPLFMEEPSDNKKKKT